MYLTLCKAAYLSAAIKAAIRGTIACGEETRLTSPQRSSKTTKTIFPGKMRELKHHEQRLLKRVDFLNYKQDQNHRDAQVLRRYHIQNREDYFKYTNHPAIQNE
jgi:Ribosomal protein S4/S9 N-terminal domain